MYDSLQVLTDKKENAKKKFWTLVMEEDAHEQGRDKKTVFSNMKAMYLAMKASDEEYNPRQKSSSGLVGTEAAKLNKRRKNKEMVCGDFVGEVMERALKISESNACMKRIVAAPTAGSCGVLPAVLISFQKRENLSDEKMTEALFVAGGIGGVIASRASISGAEGGCQAEIGAASAMAAGALTYLLGGDGKASANAAALALKNLLGLSCDPVAGLVEVPCVKRNVMGAVNALTSADMTMAGIISRIPPDEVIDAMRSIGRSMPKEIRETGLGGLAQTATGNTIREKIAL